MYVSVEGAYRKGPQLNVLKTEQVKATSNPIHESMHACVRVYTMSGRPL